MMTINLRMRQQGLLLMIFALLFFPATSSAACAGATMSAATYCVYNSGTGVVGGSVDSANADPAHAFVATSMYPLGRFFANSITKASQTITFPSLGGQAYGTADIDPGATASSGLAVNYSSDSPTIATIVNGKIHVVGAGTATITASQAGDGNYLAAAEILQTLAVDQAALTITADNQDKGYNSANPALTWTASGFVNGDTVTVLSGAPVLSTTAVTASPSGSYPIAITAGDLTAANYAFTFVPGSLTVTKTSQVITFPAMGAKSYGSADFAPGATASSGLAISYTSDTPSVATIVDGKVHLMGAGTATITASQTGDGNFLAAAEVTQTLTVAKGSQDITFPALSAQTYGVADYDPGATASSGLAVSYSSGNPSVATIVNGKIHVLGVGMATITASQWGSDNYLYAAPVEQTLTVGKAGLAIIADNKDKDYSNANPSLTWTANGFVNGDTVAVLNGAPILTTTAATNSPVGSYPIQIEAGSLAAANYSFTFADGSLTINKTVPDAPTTVTATSGDGSATVSFTPPASNGGTTIFGYTVTANPGGIVASSLDSPITVSGLSNGVAYTFTVIATNGQGASPASAPSNSITPLATTTTSTTTVTTTTATNASSTTTSTITPPPGQPNSTIRIYTPDGEQQEYYSISDTIKLQANYRDAEGWDVDARPLAHWSSTDSLIAEVGQGVGKGGTVTFKGNGEVRIFSFLNGLMDYMDFKVGANAEAKHHGNLIVLAGGKTNDDNDKLKPAIQYLCNRIYQVFKIRMFKDEDIYYINSQTGQDFNGDGVTDGIVDQSVKTVQSLYEAMQWAAAEENDGPLYLYLMDHGEKNSNFQIDNGQILSATQLDAMLDEFEEVTGRTTIVIIEACYSGSFVEKLAGSGQRMIITSSNQKEASFFSSDGAISFGQFLSNRLLAGETWEDAFDKAVDDITKIGLPYSVMYPQKWIGEQVTMGKVYGDFSMGSLFPEIKTFTQSAKVNGNLPQEFVVTLDVADIAGVSVWAMVTPPNYQPPTVSAEFTTPALGLTRFDLISQEDSPAYSGSYTFPCGGTYTVTYYAKDSKGMVVSAPPQSFTVSGTECSFTTQIAPAWNLLSLPVTPTDPAVDKVLAGVKGNLTSVWKWANNTWAVSLPSEQDGGASYASGKGFGPLTTINPGEGFWVNSTGGVKLTVPGPPASGELTLTSGWNLVGLKGAQAVPILEVTAANPGLLSIWKWDDGTWAVHLPDEEPPGAYAQSKGFADLATINPGEGFWVNKP